MFLSLKTLIVFLLFSINSIQSMEGLTTYTLELAKKYNIRIDNRLPKKELSFYIQCKSTVLKEKNFSYNKLHSQSIIGAIYKKCNLLDDAKREYNNLILFCDEIIKDPQKAIEESNYKWLPHRAYCIKMRAYGHLGEYDKALNTAKEFYQVYPFSQFYLNVKAAELEVLLEKGDYEKVLQEADFVIKYFPKCRMKPDEYISYRKDVDAGVCEPFDDGGKFIALDAMAKAYEKSGKKEEMKETLKSLLALYEKYNYENMQDEIKDIKEKLHINTSGCCGSVKLKDSKK